MTIGSVVRTVQTEPLTVVEIIDRSGRKRAVVVNPETFNHILLRGYVPGELRDVRVSSEGEPMEKPSRCRSCGVEIRWVTMQKSGKSNPLDPEPVPNGNIVLVPDTGGENATAYYVGKPGENTNESTPRYQSHFASCPQAKQHRRK